MPETVENASNSEETSSGVHGRDTVELADHYGNGTLLDKVASLYDHEGTLTVGWKTGPSEGEKEFFTKAWESVIGDGCDNVEHEHA